MTELVRRAPRRAGGLATVVARVRARSGARRLELAFEALFFVAAVNAALPLFVSRYVPIQDLPQHVAAVRVLADYSVPELGFERFFELNWAATQYLSVYVVAAALTPLFGALVATKLVVAASMIALPYAVRSLLQALHKPRSYAMLTLPLVYNAHAVLGFINFLAALPLLFYGLACAVRLRRVDCGRRAAVLGALALLCFYTHVVPYGVLMIGAVALVVDQLSWRRLRALMPLLPSIGAALVWLFVNPAGRSMAALATGAQRERPRFLSADEALRQLPEWFTDVLHGSADDELFVAWGLLLVVLFTVGAVRVVGPSAFVRDRRWLAALAPAMLLAYFVMPASYGFMWPIHARFPLLAALFAVIAVPRVSLAWRVVSGALALGLSAQTTSLVGASFRAVAQTEYLGLHDIVQRVPEGSRVAGLMFHRGSDLVRFAPFLHAVAWVQAERGGAVQFSFAEFPHSPFRFRANGGPPHVRPQWEWLPERVDAASELGWFQYVLTRGGPALDGFTRQARSGDWTLWSR